MVQNLIQLRHSLHQCAEVAFEEKTTNQKLKEFLAQYKPDQVIDQLGQTGIAFVFKGLKDKPSILFRADLDALPISEGQQLDYYSRNKGVSHKCGHDGHMAMVCAIAEQLDQIDNRGDVILFFQPAEETGMGAHKVLQDPKFDQLKIDYVFALHNIPNARSHTILLKKNVFACASTGLKIKINGHSSHACEPDLAKSPFEDAYKLIQNLQDLNSKHFDEHYFTCTLTHLKLGEESFGITPGDICIFLTLRSQQQYILDKNKIAILKSFKQTFTDFKIDIEECESFPSTTSSNEAVDYLKKAAVATNIEIQEIERPFKWSEDFGHFTARYCGAYFGLGIGDAKPLHHPEYDFNDEVIVTGQKIYTELIKQINGE